MLQLGMLSRQSSSQVKFSIVDYDILFHRYTLVHVLCMGMYMGPTVLLVYMHIFICCGTGAVLYSCKLNILCMDKTLVPSVH